MSRILVFGSINMDVVVTVPRHPQRGETLFGDSLHFIPGGKGSNQAVAAQRLGGHVVLIGRLGKDAFGTTMHSFLTGEGIDLSHLAVIDNAPTGTALITVSEDSENTIVVVSGVNKLITADEIASIDLAADDVIVSQFEVPQPAIYALFERARKMGLTTILNPAPAEPFMEGLLSLVSVLVLNETELAFLTNTPLTDDIDQLVAAARSMQAAPDQTIVVTIGARGALSISGETAQHIPSQPVHAIDTTGAGDCFVGALAVAVAEKKSMQEGLIFANAAAALSVQRLGAAVSMPTRAEVKTNLTQRQ